MRKQAIKEFYEEIESGKTKEDRIALLGDIIKEQKRTIPNMISIALDIILLIVVIGAFVGGHYINKEIKIVDTCYGEVMGITDEKSGERIPYTEEQLKIDYGIIREEKEKS